MGSGRAVGRRRGDELVVPVVAALDHHRVALGALDHHHVLDRRAWTSTASSTLGLSGDAAPLPVAAVGGDDHLGLGVVHPVDDRVGREAAEDHRVRRADAGAGQHRHRQLGDHRHVDGDPVALGHAEARQRVGEPAHLVVEVGVGDRAGVARLALPVVGDLVAPAGLDVAVEAVVADVERAADEPPGEGQVPLEHRVEVVEPGEQLAGLAGPEGLGVGRRPPRRANGRTRARRPGSRRLGGKVRSSW